MLDLSEFVDHLQLVDEDGQLHPLTINEPWQLDLLQRYIGNAWPVEATS